MLSYWSYALSLLGAVGYLLAVNGRVAGLWMGLGNQFVWSAYALTTGQPGFFFSVALFGSINAHALYAYFKKKRGKDVEE